MEVVVVCGWTGVEGATILFCFSWFQHFHASVLWIWKMTSSKHTLKKTVKTKWTFLRIWILLSQFRIWNTLHPNTSARQLASYMQLNFELQTDSDCVETQRFWLSKMCLQFVESYTDQMCHHWHTTVTPTDTRALSLSWSVLDWGSAVIGPQWFGQTLLSCSNGLFMKKRQSVSQWPHCTFSAVAPKNTLSHHICHLQSLSSPPFSSCYSFNFPSSVPAVVSQVWHHQSAPKWELSDPWCPTDAS